MFQIWLNCKSTHSRGLTSVKQNKHKENNIGAYQNQMIRFSDVKKHLKSSQRSVKKKKKRPIMYKETHLKVTKPCLSKFMQIGRKCNDIIKVLLAKNNPELSAWLFLKRIPKNASERKSYSDKS